MSFLAFAINQSQIKRAPAKTPMIKVAVMAMVGLARTIKVKSAGENADTTLLSIIT